MKLPIYFVSDNHFFMDQPKEESYRRSQLFSLFEEIIKNNGTLIIGGDFFDFWFDYGYEEPIGYRNILNELEKLSNHGVEIHYVLGNHDYWDFGYFKKKFNAKIYRGNLKFTINQQKILLTHGDGLLPRDYGYRFMRKIIRSEICISLFKILGGQIGCQLAKWVSNTSKKYNHSERKNKINHTKKEEIRKEINHYITNNWANYDSVLVGHYHQTGIDNINKQDIIYLGDWLSYYTVTCLNKNGWEQISWNKK